MFKHLPPPFCRLAYTAFLLKYVCYNKYELQKRFPPYEPLPHNPEKKDEGDDLFGDRSNKEELSNPIDFSGLNRADVEALLSMMPNTRYRNIIRLLYLEQKSTGKPLKPLE